MGEKGSKALPRRPPGYWETTRSGLYSFLFALPLLVAYEALAWILNVGLQVPIRNAADVWLKETLEALARLWGLQGNLALSLLLILALAAFFYQRDAMYRQEGIRWRYFTGMLAESLVYSLLFGGVVGILTRALLLASPEEVEGLTGLTVALGAGLYEELLFRVLLVGGLGRLGTALLPSAPTAAYAGAVVVGAFLFSASHYLGPLGDAFSPLSFLYRWVAGIVLSALYVLRGFGITAYTHALYDIWVFLATG